MTTLTGDTDEVEAVAFSADGHTLATGSADHTIRLWHVQDPTRPELVAVIPTSASIWALQLNRAGTLLATGDDNGQGQLWATNLTQARRQICATGGSGLTRTEWTQYIPERPYNPPCQRT